MVHHSPAELASKREAERWERDRAALLRAYGPCGHWLTDVLRDPLDFSKGTVRVCLVCDETRGPP